MQRVNKRNFYRSVAALMFSFFGAHQSAAQQVIWSDEFDTGSAPDQSIWTYELGAGGWGNSELQEYTNNPLNVRIENGHLVISAREIQLKGGRSNYTSARIKTENKLTFQYGSIEARIKVPNLQDGLWPAFWTLGNDISTVGWPDCGELDILEMGSASAIADGVVNQRVHSTAHWEHNGSHAEYGLVLDSATPLDSDYHLYRMDWTPDAVTTYVDGNMVWTIDISTASCTDCTEFHQPHFVLFNLAVGGGFTGLFRSTDITAPMPADMLVDWVRIYDNGFTQLGGSSQQGGNSATETHVESLSVGILGNGPSTKATAQVIVSDESAAAVQGATVVGTFSGSHNETVTVTTDVDGVADFVSSVKNRNPAFTFCVESISKAGMTYTPAANNATCSSY